ncbi:MAG: LysM domain-containing protein [Clostridia bacterium]
MREEFYYVRRGDTFMSIAQHARVPVLALTQANPYEDPTKLTEGQTLFLPVRFFRARYGDTMATIAARHGLEEGALRRMNDALSSPIPGQRYRIVEVDG